VTAKNGAGYPILPAAGFHFLTPLYDFGTALLGFGRRFKEEVVARAGLTDGMRVLDVGCGTGLLVDAVKRGGSRSTVVGVDADPRVLEIARRRIARAGHAGVDLVCARAEDTGLESASFDAALSTLVFHHLPQAAKEGAAREVARTLRPGSRFLLVDLRLHGNTAEALSAVLTRAGLAVLSVPAPKTWVPLMPTFALQATKPGP
jgi:ubiquinone/menaquinone biosynthesis C-methylase UbiE